MAVPFERRGERADEYLVGDAGAVGATTSPSTTTSSTTCRACRLYPKPVQQPHPPIHVGGESTAALRRVADIGQGWYTFNRLPEDLPEAVAQLDAALAFEGRTRGEPRLQPSVSPYFQSIGDRWRPRATRRPASTA